MTTIKKEHEVLILINAFKAELEIQQNLDDLLIDAIKKTMRHLSRFISANVHKIHDGSYVVNYVQWRSWKDFDIMLTSQEAILYMKQADNLSTYDLILRNMAHVYRA